MGFPIVIPYFVESSRAYPIMSVRKREKLKSGVL